MSKGSAKIPEHRVADGKHIGPGGDPAEGSREVIDKELKHTGKSSGRGKTPQDPSLKPASETGA